MRVGIILVSSGHVLMVHQNESLLWGFPKGGREKREDDVRCGIRELFEETGIFLRREDISEGNYMLVNDHKYYIVEFDNPTVVRIDGREIRGFEWVSISQVYKKRISYTTEKAVNKLII